MPFSAGVAGNVIAVSPTSLNLLHILYSILYYPHQDPLELWISASVTMLNNFLVDTRLYRELGAPECSHLVHGLQETLPF